MPIALVNPNTDAGVTERMVSIAREAAPAGTGIEGVTAPFGASLITDPASLAVAAEAVLALVPRLKTARAVIVAAFGDPALAALRDVLPCPVTGIAEAGMAEAAAGGRRFAVVTTTPDLQDSIRSLVPPRLKEQFAGVWLTGGDARATTLGPAAELTRALGAACARAMDKGGAEAIVIGGGPLALAARALAGSLAVPIVEPVPAAVRLTLKRLATEASP